MPPPVVSADQILDYAPTHSRVIPMEANVIAYFGDFLHAWKEGVATGITSAPVTSSRTVPASTASARNRS